MNNFGRCFGQDLMRKEHTVGGGMTSRRKADKRSNLIGAPKKPEWATGTGTENMAAGTSIFDPVLCELVYRWFCPPMGKVLDPFAGGSVRGIVAAVLGRSYTGVDLSGEQIEANKKQWEEISNKIKDADSRGNITIKISDKWLNHKFLCSKDYIINNCKGRCCQGTDKILISLLPEEEQKHKDKGFIVIDGLLQPNSKTRQCPHKLNNGLCGVHNTYLKPFGCIASPFTLNDSNTLIVRNRYSMLKCHGDGERAYKVFRASLDLIFGKGEAEILCKKLDEKEKDITALMPYESYKKLKYLDGLKHNRADNPIGDCVWHIGDSRDVKKIAKGEYDLIFSCPPYANLEVYSDDPKDISTLNYSEFIKAYREIIKNCVDMLKDDRFACFVVGDIRDKKGMYCNFVSDTIAAFQDAGAKLYNEAILITAVGSLPIRVGRQFDAGRKLGKTHQNVLVFIKGDPKKATEAIGQVECGSIEDLTE